MHGKNDAIEKLRNVIAMPSKRIEMSSKSIAMLLQCSEMFDIFILSEFWRWRDENIRVIPRCIIRGFGFRRNSIIAACLDVANLMERGGTGFQTMIESYRDSAEHLQPVVLIYPGFLDLRLYDRLYDDNIPYALHEELSDSQKVIELLRTEGPKHMKELQTVTSYKSRSQFLKEIINPLIEKKIIYRDGNAKSSNTLIKLKNK